MMRILNVVGVRPNLMKMAPIAGAIARRPGELSQVLLHTGQHYDQARHTSIDSSLQGSSTAEPTRKSTSSPTSAARCRPSSSTAG